MLSPRGITTENACPTVKHRTDMKNKAAGAMTSGNPAEEAPELPRRKKNFSRPSSCRNRVFKSSQDNQPQLDYFKMYNIGHL